MSRFVITTTKARVILYASSWISAVNAVLVNELCPVSAIVSIEERAS